MGGWGLKHFIYWVPPYPRGRGAGMDPLQIWGNAVPKGLSSGRGQEFVLCWPRVGLGLGLGGMVLKYRRED